VFQQPAFYFEPSAKSDQRSIGTDHSMARNNDRDRIAPEGDTDSASASGRTNSTGQVRVGTGLSEGDSAQPSPNLILERSSAQGQGNRKLSAQAIEVFADFPLRLPEYRQ
jgi:hypothetical protein